MSRIGFDVLMLLTGTLLLCPWVYLHAKSLAYYFGSPTTSRLLDGWGWCGVVLIFLATAGAGTGATIALFAAGDLLVYVGVLPAGLVNLPNSIFAAGVLLFLLFLLQYKRAERRFLALMADDTPRCMKCGYLLKGLKVRRGSITCPECRCAASVAEIAAEFRSLHKLAKAVKDGENRLF